VYDLELVAWTSRLARMRRSDRVYKPAMLLVVLELLEGDATPTWIPLDDVLARFDDLLARAGLSEGTRGPGRGFNPAYHLSASGVPVAPFPFWELTLDGRVVTGLPRPSTNTGLRRGADALRLLPELIPAVASPEGRLQLRWEIYELLEADDAPDSLALVRCDDAHYAQVQDAGRDLDERLHAPFSLDDPAPSYQLSLVQRRARRRAFRERVLAAYDRACSLCGVRIQWGGLIEAEAAHIKPHELRGADDVRNALALCRTHHWSFDRGLWTASPTSSSTSRPTPPAPPPTSARSTTSAAAASGPLAPPPPPPIPSPSPGTATTPSATPGAGRVRLGKGRVG
jgi:hypothetical protein